jgi:hypothetical protein
VKDGHSGDVDALGDFGMPVPEELDSEELTGFAVPRVAHRDAMAVGVVSLVIIRFATNSDRIEPRGDGLVVAQAGTGRGHLENLDDLSPEAARELPVATEGVLPGDPTLLVSRGPERKVGGPN